MFVTGLDLVYFQAQADNLSYAFAPPTLENPQMKWSWGFRVDFGYRFRRDSWLIDLSWLCLPTQKEVEKTGHLFPTWSNAPQTSDSFVDSAKVRWRLHLGIVDLILSKPWRISRRFTASPGLGVRFASLRQKFFVSYFGGNLFPGEEDTLHTKNKFWGVGPVATLNTHWEFSPSWGLLGRFGYSLVRGEFYDHEKEWAVGSRTTHFRLFDTTQANSSLANLALGLEWFFNSTRFHVLWEQAWFPNQNHLQYPVQNRVLPRPGALSIMGVSGGVLWQF